MATELTKAGGMRIAEVMMDIQRHQHHKAAAKHGQSPWHHRSFRKPWGFLQNISIALVLVPALLLLLWAHERGYFALSDFACLNLSAPLRFNADRHITHRDHKD